MLARGTEVYDVLLGVMVIPGTVRAEFDPASR